jgi:hypothetical protein
VTDSLAKPCTAFHGSRLLSSGPLIEVVLAAKTVSEKEASVPILVFDDSTGRVMDFDLRGTKAEIIARLSATEAPTTSRRSVTADDRTTEPRGRGRPKLGVTGREVTLLPRHWEWLAAQPGGASVALRKLIDEARRNGGDRQKLRVAQEIAYRFMSAMAGDLPGFEEATRALFANDRQPFDRHVADWPEDVRAYASRLAFSDTDGQAIV